MLRTPLAVPGKIFGLALFLDFSSVYGARQKLRLTKQACFLPTIAHTALALGSATGGGQARGRGAVNQFASSATGSA